ncbi:hypothetical protein NBRC10512v2_004552 [Rhodotorula toruloides]|uniref:F-box domain-containing protein n=1 Tax=Rhodotorula toruloides (strain NP11) TaxID=1130832 RepID=M7XV74_RHOT1|nr:uncharacterized protein RHTO_06152 [Rhodotorula toruloides NP11]EMS24148.1 hypothetical protein RHTO_06152 [Rhodotorula toruloides NP11]
MTTQHNHSQSDWRAVGGGTGPLVHSSDEEQATSSARRDGSQEPIAPPRLSLTSLPTEILDKVFSCIDYDIYFNPSRRVDQVLVNKRIFSVAYPVWMRRITVSSFIQHDGRDAALAGLLIHKSSAFIKVLAVGFQLVLPHLECAILHHTPNLTHLTVDFANPADAMPLPQCFFDAFRTLRHLVSLRICYVERDAAVDGFSYERDVPSLRELEISAYGRLADCAPGLSKLERLELHCFAFGGSAIPWTTLHHLDVRNSTLNKSRDYTPTAVFSEIISSIEAAHKLSPIVLRKLGLSFASQDPHHLRGYARLLGALVVSEMTDLAILHLDSLAAFQFWTCSARLPTEELCGLRVILALCPALEVLHLDCIDFYHKDTVCDGDDDWDDASLTAFRAKDVKDDILTAIQQDNLPLTFPAVFKLLIAMESTTVLDLRLQIPFGQGIRCRRTARNEVFEAEGWTSS